MKKVFWLVGGFCAAAVGFLILGAKRIEPPVEEMAQRLDESD